MQRLYVYARFERFWHWMQALLVLALLLTGFEIHGSWRLLGFGAAVRWHTLAAWSLIALWAFAIFWHLTTGEWRQYLPRRHLLGATLRHYAVGIFRGEPHPFEATRARKHNPVQALAYLGLKLLVHPLLWITGLLALYRPELAARGLALDLGGVAGLHTVGAFLLLAFLIGHLYLITTGPSLGAQLRAMLTGWETVERGGPG